MAAGNDDLDLPDLEKEMTEPEEAGATNGGDKGDLDLPDLAQEMTEQAEADAPADGDKEEPVEHAATELEAVFDVPVQVSAVLGKATMEVSNLLKLNTGAVVELDRKVGEAIDIYVNNRLVARGEVVVIDERLGVTMTEIIKVER